MMVKKSLNNGDIDVVFDLGYMVGKTDSKFDLLLVSRVVNYVALQVD